MRITRSLQSRLLLGAAVWGMIALAVTGLLLHYLLRTQLESDIRQRLANDLNQLLAQIEVLPGQEPVPRSELSDPLYQRIYSGHYWQITRDDRVIARSRSLWDQQLPVPDVADQTPNYRYISGPRQTPLLTYTRRVTLPKVSGALRLEVSTDVRELNLALARFAVVIAIGFAALTLGLILAALVQVRVGLRPLRRMRSGLAEIRAGGADGLRGDYPDEIQPLVDDLNLVLQDNQSLIERARTRAGNLAHALKTPLSILTNEADFQRKRGDVALGNRLLQETTAMQRHIDWHLAHARIAGTRRPGRRTQVLHVLQRLERTLTRLYPDKKIHLRAGSDLAFRGESQDLEQMLGNLIENACKWASRNIFISVMPDPSGLLITVQDDGLGLAPEARSKAMQRGNRLDESTPGDGLGLSIVRDLAELYGGGLTLENTEAGGLSAQLQLPQA